MMDTDRFNLGDWVYLYEELDNDGYLNKKGKKELKRLKEKK